MRAVGIGFGRGRVWVGIGTGLGIWTGTGVGVGIWIGTGWDRDRGRVRRMDGHRGRDRVAVGFWRGSFGSGVEVGVVIEDMYMDRYSNRNKCMVGDRDRDTDKDIYSNRGRGRGRGRDNDRVEVGVRLSFRPFSIHLYSLLTRASPIFQFSARLL